MRLGVFGGTFDPPHWAHLILADEARYQLQLDQVLWVLTAYPPHKSGREISPWQQRLALVEAAIADNPYFKLSTVEIDRLPPHYAYETVRLLAENNPGSELIYLMGGDSLGDLPDWKEPRIFLQNCSALGVMHRPGEKFDLLTLEAILPGLLNKVRFVDAPGLDISSIDLRERIRTGKPARYYLPPAVYEVIVRLRLYQDNYSENLPQG